MIQELNEQQLWKLRNLSGSELATIKAMQRGYVLWYADSGTECVGANRRYRSSLAGQVIKAGTIQTLLDLGLIYPFDDSRRFYLTKEGLLYQR